MNITDLKKRITGVIEGFDTDDEHMEVRFREIGFAEGDEVEVLHTGLFGHSPLNIRLHGTMIALRRKEARMIRVRPVSS